MSARRAHATIEELADHASSLASAFGIQVINDVSFSNSFALTSTPNNRRKVAIVHVAPVTTEECYAVALHEYGHSQAAYGTLRTSVPKSKDVVRVLRVRLEEEIAAWDWAEYFALVWTDAMRRTRVLAQGSYEEALRVGQMRFEGHWEMPPDYARAARIQRKWRKASIADLARRLKRR